MYQHDYVCTFFPLPAIYIYMYIYMYFFPKPVQVFHPTASRQHIRPPLVTQMFSYLLHMAQHYYDNGLAPTTRSTYATGQYRYTTFCRSINVQHMPATGKC